MRAWVSSICRIMAWTRRVRRLSSSTRMSILRRRRMNRLRASTRAAAGVRRWISRLKSRRFSCERCWSVARLWGMRAMICSLVNRSVSETLIVRSKGSAPRCTFSNAESVFCIAKAQPITLRRNRLRVTSIFLASEISSSRAKSGISAICERYMRIGSLLHFATSAGGGGGFGHRLALGKPLGRRGVLLGLLPDVVEFLGRGLVDQVDALFLQGDQQVVELVGIDFLVGQVLVDLVIGQIALRFPLGDQLLQVLVE